MTQKNDNSVRNKTTDHPKETNIALKIIFLIVCGIGFIIPFFKNKNSDNNVSAIQDEKSINCISNETINELDLSKSKELISQKCKESIEERFSEYTKEEANYLQSFCECRIYKSYQILGANETLRGKKYLNTVATKGAFESDSCYLDLISSAEELAQRTKEWNLCEPWCKTKNFLDLVKDHKYLPQYCLFNMPKVLTVVQQMKYGTLVQMSENIYYIAKNPKDSSLVDNEFVPEGVFQRNGSYRYTNILGTTKTVYRLKRIE